MSESTSYMQLAVVILILVFFEVDSFAYSELSPCFHLRGSIQTAKTASLWLVPWVAFCPSLPQGTHVLSFRRYSTLLWGTLMVDSYVVFKRQRYLGLDVKLSALEGAVRGPFCFSIMGVEVKRVRPFPLLLV